MLLKEIQDKIVTKMFGDPEFTWQLIPLVFQDQVATAEWGLCIRSSLDPSRVSLVTTIIIKILVMMMMNRGVKSAFLLLIDGVKLDESKIIIYRCWFLF